MIVPWVKDRWEGRGHGYLTYRLKGPRDGRMGQKDEGDHWEENETQVAKASEDLDASWRYTPHWKPSFLSTYILSVSVTSSSSWTLEKQFPHSLRKERLYGEQCATMGLSLGQRAGVRVMLVPDTTSIIAHCPSAPFSPNTESHIIVVKGIRFEVRATRVCILVLNSVVQGK